MERPNLKELTPASRRFVERLAKGGPIKTWDPEVNHSTLAAAMARGIITVDKDCTIRLNPEASLCHI